MAEESENHVKSQRFSEASSRVFEDTLVLQNKQGPGPEDQVSENILIQGAYLPLLSIFVRLVIFSHSRLNGTFLLSRQRPGVIIDQH